MAQAKPNLFRRLYDWTLALAERKISRRMACRDILCRSQFLPHPARRTSNSSLPRRPKKGA